MRWSCCIFDRAGSADTCGIRAGTPLGRHACTRRCDGSGCQPIARRIESWASNPDGSALQRLFGFCETEGALPAGDEGLALAADVGSIAAAFATGVPQISQDATAEPQGIGAAAKAAGLQTLLAIPVVTDDAVGEVVVLYF